MILSHLSGEPAWSTCFQLGSSEPDVGRPERTRGTATGKPGLEWERRQQGKVIKSQDSAFPARRYTLRWYVKSLFRKRRTLGRDNVTRKKLFSSFNNSQIKLFFPTSLARSKIENKTFSHSHSSVFTAPLPNLYMYTFFTIYKWSHNHVVSYNWFTK